MAKQAPPIIETELGIEKLSREVQEEKHPSSILVIEEGIMIVLRLGQLPNVYFFSSVMVDGMVIVDNPHPLKQLSPRDVTEDGMVISDKDSHPQKHSLPIDVTDDGIIIEDNDLHPLKNLLSKLVIVDGKLMLLSELQPLNEAYPILTTELGIFTDSNDSQPKKHPPPPK